MEGGASKNSFLRHVLEVVGSRCANVGHDMVDNAVFGGRRLHLLHPGVLSKAGRDDHVLILHDSGCGHVERLRKLKHDVGLGNSPTLGKLFRRRQFLRIAFQYAAIDPSNESVDIRVRKRRIVRKVADVGIGEPRRHLVLQHGLFDRLGPWTSLLVGEQWKRSGLAGPVATLAVALQDRRHVPGESRRGGFRRRLRVQTDGGARAHYPEQHPSHKFACVTITIFRGVESPTRR